MKFTATHTIVSPLYPAGVTWLLNALLELGVRVFRYGDRPTWIQNADGISTLVPEERELARHMPALARSFTFRFREPSVSVRWTHEWPGRGSVAGPTLLMLRGGADSLYSHYKRFSTEPGFGDYLRSPDNVGFAAEGFQPRLPPAETWAIFSLLWRRLRLPSAPVLAFEDMKREPVESLRLALRFIGIKRTPAEIESAAEASRFERAREAEEAFLREQAVQTDYRVNRSGRVGEANAAFSPDDWACMHGLPAAAMRELGYEPLPGADGAGAARAALSLSGGASGSVRAPAGLIGDARVSDGAARLAELVARVADAEQARRGLARTAVDCRSRRPDPMELGLAIAACDWTRDLTGGSPNHDTSRRILEIMMDLLPRLTDRPLARMLAARSLAGIGAFGSGVELLKPLIAGSSALSFGERVELARTCGLAGRITERNQLAARAAPHASTPARAEALAAARRASDGAWRSRPHRIAV